MKSSSGAFGNFGTSWRDMATKPAPALLDEIDPSTVLLNSDLNDKEYAFVQRYEGKWIDRLYKDKGAEAEWRFAEKWLARFLSERTNPPSVDAAVVD